MTAPSLPADHVAPSGGAVPSGGAAHSDGAAHSGDAAHSGGAVHLEVLGLVKRFARSAAPAVDGVSFSARRGELVALLGPSGCGKSTTLRLIAGFEAPDAGHVRIDGEDVTAVPPNRRGVGMVFQSYALFPNLSVFENVAFGLRLRRLPDADVRRRVGELLALVRLADLGGRSPAQLSGGQQQRVALARALAIEPRLLLLDEPLAALDAVVRQELRSEIRRIQARLGTTTLYVTHDQEEALSLSDRVVVINRGRIEQVGTPQEIYDTPKTAFVAGFVGRLNVLDGVLAEAAAGAVTVPGGSLRVGRPLPHPTGAALRVAVRPEHLALTPWDSADAAQPNRASGVVEEVEFLGSLILVHVRVADARLTVQELNSPNRYVPTAGTRVAVRFSPESVLVLADAPGATP